jgi:hypothetical protein
MNRIDQEGRKRRVTIAAAECSMKCGERQRVAEGISFGMLELARIWRNALASPHENTSSPYFSPPLFS